MNKITISKYNDLRIQKALRILHEKETKTEDNKNETPNTKKTKRGE